MIKMTKKDSIKEIVLLQNYWFRLNLKTHEKKVI